MDTPEIDYPKLAQTFLDAFREYVKEDDLQLIVDRSLFKKFGGPTRVRLYSKVTKTSCRLTDAILLKQRFTLDADEMQQGEERAWSQIHDAYDGILAQTLITVDGPDGSVFLQELEGLDADEIPRCPFDLSVHIGSLLTTTCKGMLGNIYPNDFFSRHLAAQEEPEAWTPGMKWL